MSRERNGSSVVVLLSGGIDSTALVHYYLSKNYEVRGIYFNYGHTSSKREQIAALKISQYYKIQIQNINLGITLNHKNGEFFARNALFIFATAGCLPDHFSKIAIGIHSGVSYYDCTELFLKDCQNILDGYFGGTVVVAAPFVSFTKLQIYEYCIENNIPLELTYSCEKSSEEPCGICPSCIDRRILDEL